MLSTEVPVRSRWVLSQERETFIERKDRILEDGAGVQSWGGRAGWEAGVGTTGERHLVTSS
jgi:antibiotic biosynthesis monooxygenase (ABM) superfamily enzyme